jgi:hypothetical protein
MTKIQRITKGIFNIYIKEKVMKEFIAKYQKAIVGTGAVSVLLICYLQQKELSKLRSEQKIEVLGSGDISKAQTIDSLQHKIDSLEAEMWPLKVELNRHEIAYEIFLERNPKAAQQYGTIISDETE